MKVYVDYCALMLIILTLLDGLNRITSSCYVSSLKKNGFPRKFRSHPRKYSHIQETQETPTVSPPRLHYHSLSQPPWAELRETKKKTRPYRIDGYLQAMWLGSALFRLPSGKKRAYSPSLRICASTGFATRRRLDKGLLAMSNSPRQGREWP